MTEERGKEVSLPWELQRMCNALRLELDAVVVDDVERRICRVFREQTRELERLRRLTR